MLNLLAVFLVCSGIGIAVHIAIDLTHRPQSMKIMNAVWILTALWGSYLALWAYNKFGKSVPMKMGEDEMKMDMSMGNMPMEYPHWQSVALSALHCGAGCTLADIIGEWVTNYIPVTVAGSQLIGNWIVYFILFVNEPLPKDTWMFWFMMQLAMLVGFFCAYPMNALLIKLGVKKGM